MLLGSRSWLYASMIQRAYSLNLSSLKKTHQIATHQLQSTPPLKPVLKMRRRGPAISTLRPEKLVHSDFLVLAGKIWLSFHTQLSLHSPAKHKNHRQSTPLTYRAYWANKPDDAKHDVDSEVDDSTTRTASDVVGEVKRRAKVLVREPFPEDARGFLYLHQPPRPESGLPRSASSIRFRCVPSLVEASSSYIASLKFVKVSTPHPNPATPLPPSLTNGKIYEAFKVGYDLTLPSRIPWGIPVVTVAGCPSLEHVRMQLLEDKFFNASELQEYADMYKNTVLKTPRTSTLLHTLGDVFPVRFDSTIFTVWITAGKGKASGKSGETLGQAIPESRGPHVGPRSSCFEKVFADWRSKYYGGKLPYTGAAYVRFELVPASKPSKPALALRIVKITEPVECVIPDYDGYIPVPEEGELFMRGLPGKTKPWICQLDPSVRKHSAMLALVPGRAANANSR